MREVVGPLMDRLIAEEESVGAKEMQKLLALRQGFEGLSEELLLKVVRGLVVGVQV